MAQVQFTQFYSASDFGITSSTSQVITAGQYNQVGKAVTGAKQIIGFGIGVIANGVDSRETAKITLKSAGGEIPGNIRLAVQDANGIQTIPVYTNNDTNFNSGVKLGLVSPQAQEDSKLLILYNPSSTTTLDGSQSGTLINMPVTITNLV